MKKVAETPYVREQLGEGIPSWVPGRRPRGDTPMTCLVFIILCIVGSIWGYYRFFHNRALENAGKDIIIVDTDDPDARNTYLRRMRDPLLPSVRMAGVTTRDACNEILTGKIKDPTLGNERLNPAENRLRELIGEVNGQGAPKQFTEIHRKLAQSVGQYWKAVSLVRQGLGAKDTKDKNRLFKSAREELGRALQSYNQAEAGIRNATR